MSSILHKTNELATSSQRKPDQLQVVGREFGIQEFGVIEENSGIVIEKEDEREDITDTQSVSNYLSAPERLSNFKPLQGLEPDPSGSAQQLPPPIDLTDVLQSHVINYRHRFFDTILPWVDQQRRLRADPDHLDNLEVEELLFEKGQEKKIRLDSEEVVVERRVSWMRGQGKLAELGGASSSSVNCSGFI
jgi:hypothetical protein